jgi:hypothetical protein
MKPTQIHPPAFAKGLMLEAEVFLKSVMEAVNEAEDGEWIDGSEEQVRDLSAGFRKRVFEKAVQARIDAAEAAFPPSAGCDDRKTAEQQRSPVDDAADDQRPH